MAKEFLVDSTHIETHYSESEKKRLLRILSEINTSKQLSEDVQNKVQEIIDLLNGDSNQAWWITCKDVVIVRNALPWWKKDKRFLQDSANKIWELHKDAQRAIRSKKYGTGWSFQIYLRQKSPVVVDINDLVLLLEVALNSFDATFEDVKPFIKNNIYWRLNSPALTLALSILEREKDPFIWNLDMLLSRYQWWDFTFNQSRLIRSIRTKAWKISWTIRSPFKAWHPKHRFRRR